MTNESAYCSLSQRLENLSTFLANITEIFSYLWRCCYVPHLLLEHESKKLAMPKPLRTIQVCTTLTSVAYSVKRMLTGPKSNASLPNKQCNLYPYLCGLQQQTRNVSEQHPQLAKTGLAMSNHNILNTEKGGNWVVGWFVWTLKKWCDHSAAWD
jgi:hypothetical protein